jgi:hypothetical protein
MVFSLKIFDKVPARHPKERLVLAEAVSKRIKKSSEMKFTPFTCQNKVNY